MIKSRKGFELSINFIVMLILTMVVFGSTIMIAMKIMDQGKELKDKVDKQTEDKLVSLLTSGREEVVIAIDTKECRINKHVEYALGIKNRLNGPRNFTINVTPSTAIYSNGEQVNNLWKDDWDVIYGDLNEISRNEYKTIPILIHVGKGEHTKKGGTYVFNVNITYIDNNNYIPYPIRDNGIQKIKVKVI